MSALRFSSMRAPVIHQSTASIRAQRSFHSSRILAAGKESAVHDENRASKVEAEKQDQFNKAKQTGKGEWKEDLASDSESVVKADRSEFQGAEKSIKELQKESAERAQKEKKGQ